MSFPSSSSTSTFTTSSSTSTEFWELGFDINGDFVRMWREIDATIAEASEREIPSQQTDEDPFFTQYGRRLPAGFREIARGMSWSEFMGRFCPTASLRTVGITTTRLRAGMMHFAFELAQHTSEGLTHIAEEITGTGPAQAITQILASRGRHVEMLNFHQAPLGEATVTFIHATARGRNTWSIGFGPTPERSVASALCAAAEILHGSC